MNYDYDVIIVGAGPGGSTAALLAAEKGLKILLLDKKKFPRDKICGDALSGKAVVLLKKLGLTETLEALSQIKIHRVLFSSPNHQQVDIKYKSGAYSDIHCGYVSRRRLFDHLLLQKAKEKVDVLEGFSVEELLKSAEQVVGVKGCLSGGKALEFTAKVVVGADGFSSIVARKQGLYKHDPAHTMVATRAYYTGVTGMSDAIEIHFIKGYNPGYFWIFPLDQGVVNVGLCVLHKDLKRKKIRLRNAHIQVTEGPFFRDRFKDAQLIGDIQGGNLPLGSKRRSVHGNGFVLIGDAAGLIDPFTGEGIGNAMYSGKIAAETLAEICQNGSDFSQQRLAQYADTLWKKLGRSLSLAYKMQKMASRGALVNLIIGRAAKSPEVADWMSNLISGTVSRKELLTPLTYLKLWFK